MRSRPTHSAPRRRYAPGALLLAVVLAAVLPSLPVPAAEQDEDRATGIFQLRHVDANSANAALRTILEIRRIFVDGNRQMIVLADSPEKIEAARRLLAHLDVPPPRWTCEILALGPERPTKLRKVTLEREKLQMVFGSPVGGEDEVSVTIDVHDLHTASLGFEYKTEVLAHARGGPDLEFRETGAATLEEPFVMSLLEVRLPAQQEALARVLGVGHPVRELRLRLTPRPAGEGAG